ncbi:hypothetical protein GGR57DRAFT_372323 [Xylariaceae sp. FL1272]|nr:hypothetical protein GGR57DRAFT_372323 [Xylariaceae sp. FL1272]
MLKCSCPTACAMCRALFLFVPFFPTICTRSFLSAAATSLEPGRHASPCEVASEVPTESMDQRASSVTFSLTWSAPKCTVLIKRACPSRLHDLLLTINRVGSLYRRARKRQYQFPTPGAHKHASR